jgi:hypothetical protein
LGDGCYIGLYFNISFILIGGFNGSLAAPLIGLGSSLILEYIDYDYKACVLEGELLEELGKR